MTTIVNPPWLYSYQCGSALLVNYTPVLLYSYVLSGCIFPVMKLLILFIPVNELDRWLPRALCKVFFHETILSGIIPPSTSSHTLNENSPTSSFSTTTASGRTFLLRRKRRLFNASVVVSRRMIDFAVLMTFGLACPVLGVVVCFGVISNGIMWRVLIGRYVELVQKVNGEAFNRLELSTEGMLKGAESCAWIVVMTVCAFWGGMSFDMVADVYGDISGYYVMVSAILLLPRVLFLCVYRKTILRRLVNMVPCLGVFCDGEDSLQESEVGWNLSEAGGMSAEMVVQNSSLNSVFSPVQPIAQM